MFDLFSYLTEMEVSVVKNESLKKHSTMRVGGECEFYVQPDTIDKLILTTTICKMYDIKYFVVGNGSNVIFTDKGYKGVIICTKEIKGISLKGNILTAKCGNNVREVSNFCLENELGGFENLSGIPATIGGAVYMNAGAYGSEIKDVIMSAKVLDKDGNVFTINKKDMNLQYRHTNFSDDGLLVLEANFYLKKVDVAVLKETIAKNDEQRKTKQPIDKKSVGSTFKRPKEGFAAQMIDEAGLKGYTVGGAKVSEKHAGFVINDNNATFDDLYKLINHIKDTVYEKNSVLLELEAIIVGEV